MREQLAGKTRVYPQKSRYTREIPERASTRRARPTPRVPAPTAARTACSSTRTAPCVLATSAKTQKAASAPGTACRRRCGRRGRATFCYKIEAVLGMRLCDPDQLIGKKRRNKLTAADTLFATSRDVSLERMNTTRVSPTHAGWLELEELYENCGTDERLSGGRKHVVSVCV